VPNCPYDEIVAAYHERLPMLTGVRVMSDARKRALKARWREDPERQNVEFWARYFGYVATSDFLMGNPGPWAADFEWIIQAGNFIKIIEGKYHQELDHAGQ